MAIYLQGQMIGINSHTNIIQEATISGSSNTVTLQAKSVNRQGIYQAENGTAFSSVTVGPELQLVNSWSADTTITENIPSYSTSNQVLQAISNLDTKITLDYTNYDYYVVQRLLAIPEYSIAENGKGKVEYDFTASLMRILDTNGGTFKSRNQQISYNSLWVPTIQQNFYCSIYWSSATAIAPYNTTTYGIIMVPNTPSISSGVATFRTPTINMRGHTTYFSQTYFDALTSIRIQYIIECYQVPKGSSVIDSWSMSSQRDKILNCIYNKNGKLE